MASPVHEGEKFTYSIPVPSLARTIAFVNIAILIALFIGIPLAASGSEGIVGSFQDDPSLCLNLVGGFGCLIWFFALLAYPPRSFRARLEFDSDSVKFSPLPVLRWIGEPSTEAQIGQKVQEILICEGRQSNSLVGFRVLLRGAAGADHEIEITNQPSATHFKGSSEAG